jgi:hypothetical protein
MNNKQIIIRQTIHWLESVIIKHNICPFAKKEHERGSIHYQVNDNKDLERCLLDLMIEFLRLDNDSKIETTLFILSSGFDDFDYYLDCLELASQLLIEQNYEGIYQLASFHPDYCFDEVPEQDPANYTNRSPYPMLHIIREASLEKALQSYPDPEQIPTRNIEFCRAMGNEKMHALLAACYQSK